MNNNLAIQKRETRGRKPVVKPAALTAFNPASIQIFKGSDLHFDPSILDPLYFYDLFMITVNYYSMRLNL